MKLAVVEIAGKQFLVQEGDLVETEKLSRNAGEKVSFPRILLFWDGKKLALGQPYLKGYSVTGKVVEEGKGPKVISYKYKRRKGYRRKLGHRQIVFKVKVEKIVGPSRARKAAPEKEEPLAKKIAPKKKEAPKKKTAAQKETGAKKITAPKKKKK